MISKAAQALIIKEYEAKNGKGSSTSLKLL